MCISKEMFEQYSGRIESLVGEVRLDVMELKKEVGDVKKDVAEVKNDTKDLSRDIADVKKDTRKTEEHLKHINGSVKKHETRIHDMEVARSPEYRVVGCPQNMIIKELSESLMSAAVLREYLKEQARESNRKFGLWIAIASFILMIITLAAMYSIG
jgi:septal ring factor EnvC (AmiA/AmiB activator)